MRVSTPDPQPTMPVAPFVMAARGEPRLRVAALHHDASGAGVRTRVSIGLEIAARAVGVSPYGLVYADVNDRLWTVRVSLLDADLGDQAGGPEPIGWVAAPVTGTVWIDADKVVTSDQRGRLLAWDLSETAADTSRPTPSIVTQSSGQDLGDPWVGLVPFGVQGMLAVSQRGVCVRLDRSGGVVDRTAIPVRAVTAFRTDGNRRVYLQAGRGAERSWHGFEFESAWSPLPETDDPNFRFAGTLVPTPSGVIACHATGQSFRWTGGGSGAQRLAGWPSGPSRTVERLDDRNHYVRLGGDGRATLLTLREDRWQVIDSEASPTSLAAVWCGDPTAFARQHEENRTSSLRRHALAMASANEPATQDRAYAAFEQDHGDSPVPPMLRARHLRARGEPVPALLQSMTALHRAGDAPPAALWEPHAELALACGAGDLWQPLFRIAEADRLPTPLNQLAAWYCGGELPGGWLIEDHGDGQRQGTDWSRHLETRLTGHGSAGPVWFTVGALDPFEFADPPGEDRLSACLRRLGYTERVSARVRPDQTADRTTAWLLSSPGSVQTGIVYTTTVLPNGPRGLVVYPTLCGDQAAPAEAWRAAFRSVALHLQATPQWDALRDALGRLAKGIGFGEEPLPANARGRAHQVGELT